MADGYARASGRPGVIVVTTGPGATNALTPLVESQAGSQPVLLVMSDIPSALIGQDWAPPRGTEPDRLLPAGLPVGRCVA
jgi:thiamine pyrophosphate-dependent acetolactate synthase large subunit-like protein